MKRLPSLPSLGLDGIVSPDQLKGLGFATLGGAIGSVGGGFAADLLGKLPIVSQLPPYARQGVVGTVGALAVGWGDDGHTWRSDVAKGIAAHLVGGEAIGGFIKNMLGLSLGALPEEEQLAAENMDDTVPSEAVDTDLPEPDLQGFGEVDMPQSFHGLGVSVEDQKPLGSWMQ